MKKPASILKKLVELLPRKKKTGNAYLKKDIRIHAGPDTQGKQQGRRRRLERLKQRLLAKKQQPETGYSKPAGSKKMTLRLAGPLFLAAIVLLIWGFDGREKLEKGLQSIAFFKVGKVEFSGCSMVPEDRLLEASGLILRQTSLFGLDASQVEAKLGDVPWVERAVVKRDWPSTVEIAIEENTPVAILNTPQSGEAQLQYIDEKGMQILPVLPGADVDFPIITGLMEITDEQQREKSLAEVLIFLRKVASNDPHLPVQSVSEVHINQVGEIVVYMVEYPFPIFFGNGNTRQNYSRLIQVLRALYKKPNGKELLSQIEYIQMDYLNDKVLVAQSGSGL
ncbi:MAG: hypothetical protein VR65_25585 [Desulfobulbaceae bacterium BRH_c16a]|nr:MAG: hypothetical protein VR65_25585 [Desulfobulbaceae bacterium BRH_c16a]